MEPNDLGQEITRRAMLRRAGLGVGALALPGLLSACGGDDDGGGGAASSGGGAKPGESRELTKLLDSITSKKVIVATYGGTTEAARRKAFWDPFTKRTGVKVITPDSAGTLGDDQITGKIKPRWDAYHASSYQVLFALRNGKEPVPKVPIAEDLTPAAARPYMWQSFLIGYVTGSLKGTFDAPPASPADFFDTKKFPGKRAWPTNYFVDATNEMALLADGVAPDALYPLDLERANAKINTIWDDLVFYESYPQIQTFLTSKTVAMAWGPSGIFAVLPAKGHDVDIMWEGVVTSWNNEAIIPGAPNMDAVLALAAWCTDPSRQAEFCATTHYGPPSKAAFEKMPEDVRSTLPNSPGRNGVPLDDDWYSKNYDAMYANTQKLFESH